MQLLIRDNKGLLHEISDEIDRIDLKSPFIWAFLKRDIILAVVNRRNRERLDKEGIE